MQNRIREKREALQLTRIQCAQQMHVAESTIWRWEETDMLPQPKAMRKLAQVLKTTPAELFPQYFALFPDDAKNGVPVNA
jgi:transcriptional regulator with XRE-family HTH domain